ncbi:MAG: PA0069 family radical SAM protein [Parvibaculum sp.]|nr:PA0069 family radical SAM protein [Parvibaculum sp.]
MTARHETARSGHPARPPANSPIGPTGLRPHRLTEPSPLAPKEIPSSGRRGRGALTNDSGRFEHQARVLTDDGWDIPDAPTPLRTEVTAETARTILTRNTSPDVPFDRSINPYRGCEHGCVYCFARPTHAYMGLSAGLDFESKLFAKPNAATLLAKELSRKGYEPAPIAMGTNTDPYQPIEQTWRITRSVLEVLSDFNHPVTIVTKSVRVTRDLDILSDMAKRNLVKVALSVTTLDAKLARTMEPRASTPAKRMEAMKLLSEAGVPVGVMVAPIIPALNDAEIEKILTGAHYAGAQSAGFVLLRLPLEIKDLFEEWLKENLPDRADRVMSLIRSTRGGKAYDSDFSQRMRGTGPYAWQISRRFELACKKLGLARGGWNVDSSNFRVPGRDKQLELI